MRLRGRARPFGRKGRYRRCTAAIYLPTGSCAQEIVANLIILGSPFLLHCCKGLGQFSLLVLIIDAPNMQLLETSPPDASQRLTELKGTDLLEFFRSLHWTKCLKFILLNLSDSDLKSVLQSLINSFPDDHKETLSIGDSKEELLEYLLIAYKISIVSKSTSRSITADVERVWACRTSDELGRVDVARAVDIVYVKEHQHRQSLPIAKLLEALGLNCSEIPAQNGRPTPFYVTKMRAATAVKLLVAFWEGNVSVTSSEGFIGRFYDEEEAVRRKLFSQYWTAENVESLDLIDVRSMVNFLSQEGDAVSPSNASGRRFLFGLIGSGEGNPLLVPHSGMPGGARALGETQIPRPTPVKVPDVNDVARVVSKFSLGQARTVQKGKNILLDDAYEEDDDHADVIESGSGALATRIVQKYAALPPRMQQLLAQGGPRFQELYKPIKYQISTYKDMEALLRYFHEGERFTWDICHSAGLTVDPKECLDLLETAVVFRIRPERRRANNLAFPPSQRRAPFELIRFMGDGSIRQWVENLAARAGNPAKDNADGYPARQILTSGLALCSLLDEFHPQVLIYGAAVERLVRHLLVLERLTMKDRADRGAFLAEKLSFMGIGGSALPETAELL